MPRGCWNCRKTYIASLEEWLPVRPLGSGYRKLGELS